MSEVKIRPMFPTLDLLLVAGLVAGALLVTAGSAAGQESPSPGAADAARSVTLDEAVDLALGNSPSLLRARADVGAAEADRLAAVGAFLPDLSVGYGYSNASTGRLDPTGQSITRTSNSLQIGGELELFDGMRRFRELDRARAGLRAERARGVEARYRTILDVKTAFFNALARRQLVAVQESRVERLQSQLGFVRERVRSGKATASDSLRSRVDLNDARVALIRARNDARAATFALAEAIGVREPLEPAAESELAAPEVRIPREEALALVARAAPALDATRASSEAAAASLSAAKGSYLPSLGLSGGYAWQAEDFPPENRSWEVRLTASYPLFDGLRRETDIQRAESRLRAARAEQTRQELALRSAVDGAYGQIEAARAAVRLAEESVAASREDLRVTEERYRLGLATILDLQAAQTGVAQAEADLVRSRFDHRLGVAQLEAVLGRDLDAPGGAR